MTLGFALDSHSCPALSPSLVLLLSWKTYFSSCTTSLIPQLWHPTWQRALLWRKSWLGGLSQEHRDLSALAWGRTPSSASRQCTREDLHCSKANIFQALDNLMVKFIASFPLSGLIVICQVALGPEGLPDWVIFSEKSSKDEGFRCAFSMNHKLQAAGLMWGTCPPKAVRPNKAGVRCDILGAVTFPRRIWHLWFLVLVLGIPTETLDWIYINIYSTKDYWALKHIGMVLAV